MTRPTVQDENQAEVNYVPTGVSIVDIESDTGSTRAVYSKLETTVDTFPTTTKGQNEHFHSGNGPSLSNYPSEEPLHEILFTFLMSIFYLSFSLGIAFWHQSEGHEHQAHATLAILFISAILIQLAYAFNRQIRKANIWDASKIFAILTVIPGTLTIFLSFADLIFGIKEAKDRSYVRPWKNTHGIYLVESLVLVLPQCVVQSVYLLEDPESIPKIKGLFVLFSLGLMTIGIALARIRFDSAHRPDRFGSGVDKIVRSAVIWGNKGLWVTTFALLVVTMRLIHPDSTIFTVAAILCLIVTYEVPILLSSINSFRFCIAKISGIFFLIPQFVSLFALILWVNTDDTVYLTNIGICAMGAFSWFESLTLIGWLLDGCNDREIDILPFYPHFLGDVYSGCCKKENRN